MVKLFILGAVLLSGCADHHRIKPFECVCECDDTKFKCSGISVSTEESKTKNIAEWIR